MKFVHLQKFIRTSPRKLRLVADVVKDLDPEKAVEVLPHTGKRAALPLQKALKAAIGNAKDQKVTGQLIIKELQILEGPRLKRGRAASRGRWHPYKRRMSHIKVILETIESKETKIAKKESTKKEESKKTKKVSKDAAKKAVKKSTKK